MDQVMNCYGKDGWDVAFMLLEKKRMLIFWQRESAVITFARTMV
jgi:hypothetical protein